MVSLFQSLRTRPRNQLLDRLLNELKATYKFDVFSLMMFDDDQNFAIVLESDISKEQQGGMENDSIDLNFSSQYLINLLLKEKQIIICDGDDLTYHDITYQHLLKDTAKETYIPLFSQFSDGDKIIGCIYFAAYHADVSFGDQQTGEDVFKSKLDTISFVFNTVYEKYTERRNFLSVINVFCEIYRNQYRYINHPFNVAHWALLIAEELKLNERQKYQLYLAAVLHDIGKLLVPQSIINKPGKLTKSERHIIRKHSQYGCNILKSLNPGNEIFVDLENIVKCHHERYDGKGYPEGLQGEDIPVLSRVITVADSVDAMLSERSYKTSKSVEMALTDLANNRGKMFDPQIADIMSMILIKQKNDIESILGPVTWGTLIVTSKNSSYNFQGNLVRRLTGFEFVANEFNFIKKIKKATS